jgi:hypothetical protein
MKLYNHKDKKENSDFLFWYRSGFIAPIKKPSASKDTEG